MKVFFESLGCDKNLTDAEFMLGLLRDAGYEFTDDDAEADVIVVNTCCFIGDAKEESIRTILRLAERKENGCCRALIVTGCLAERYKDELFTELPEIDGALGTASFDHIVELLDQVLLGKAEEHPFVYESIDRLPQISARRVVTTGGHYAYLKIAEGCDKCCTYCIIPKIRGHYRSIPMEQLLKQARELVEGGVRELILVAQETTLYGTDLYGKKMLPELIRQLAALEDLHWIRILYCYPEEIDDALIEALRTEPKLCHYLDLPIQHGADTVLKRMGRRTTSEELRTIIGKLRAAVPDIALRTTLIAGFPGETEEEHQASMDFVREMRFERLGVFTYSREEDTPAFRMKPQVQQRMKVRRQKQLMELQQKIAFEKADAMAGRRLEVMVEGRLEEDDVYVARTYMDAPDVDGYLFFRDGASHMSGDFVTITVDGANGYDLMGETSDEFTE